MRTKGLTLLLLVLITFSGISHVNAQVNFAPWGNIRGILYADEVVPFETSIRIKENSWENILQTRHYGLEPSFKSKGKLFLNESVLDGTAYSQKVTDHGDGKAIVNLRINPELTGNGKDVFFCTEIAVEHYSGGSILFEGKGIKNKALNISDVFTDGLIWQDQNPVKKVTIQGKSRKIEIASELPLRVFVVKGASRTGDALLPVYYHVYFQLRDSSHNQAVEHNFNISAFCIPDKNPVYLKIDPGQPGRRFDGIGGNFRLQFPETDPQVIQWCLDSLNVTWSRIGMWWSDWHPEEAIDPVAQARAGKLIPKVYEQMEMAAELSKRGLPVIVSAWFAPKWASLEGIARPGTYGEQLNPAKWEAIVESITKYLLFLKTDYGVEAVMFSFNEPEIGVRVVQSPYEHITFIKMLGSSFARHGLCTKLLLGDTSNGTPFALSFIDAGVADQSAHQYIGALGFHTWGGMENENLLRWKAAAMQLQVPLLVTESGPDSEAHRNPDLFLDRFYQQQEIDLYIRLCAVCQPQSIMQWQLTADYSVLSGGGVYGNHWPLQTTQRYYNLKQLGLTSEGSFAIPATTGGKNITAAAFGDKVNQRYAVHIVNNGAGRTITVDGIPEGINSMSVFTSSFTKKMEKDKSLKVNNGKVVFEAPAGSYITIINL